MPVWGPIFQYLDNYNEAAVRQCIKNLCEFLESIQPAAGVMFHSGGGEPMDHDKLAQLVIRPVVELIGMEWLAWLQAWHRIEFI